MQLHNLLNERKEPILTQWIEGVFATYPADSLRFIKTQKDQFANPLGHSITKGLGDLYDYFMSDAEPEQAVSLVEHMVKVRAVQDFSASQAVSFIYDLKEIVIKQYRKEGLEKLDIEEWLKFESRLDKVALMIFDLYFENRKRLLQIRLNEINRGNHILTDGMPCPSAVMKMERKKKAVLESEK